jgi:signal transduction protein with GAF and PtsI domain
VTQPRASDAILLTLAAVARRLDAAGRITPVADDDLLTTIVATATIVLDAQAASIAVHDPVADRLVFLASAGPAGGDVVGLQIDAAAGIAGYAFTTGQQLAIADVTSDPRFDRTVADATGYLPGSILATPLTDADGTLGVLEVLDRRGGTFTLRDLEVAGALAAAAAIVVRRRRSAVDAAALLRGALVALAAHDAGAGAPALDEASIEALVSDATLALPTDPDDPTWRLADRIAGLREVDPDSVELAADWLDALLRRRGPVRRARGPGAAR